MAPRTSRKSTAVVVDVASTPAPEEASCAYDGGPGEDDDDEVGALAAPSCALTSTPHDIAERAAAAVRLDKMRKSRDAALKDREDLQVFVKELQEKLEESRNEATKARKAGGILFEENGSLKQTLKEVEVLHAHALTNERGRTLFYRTRKETIERAWAAGEPFSHHVRKGSTTSSASVRQPCTASVPSTSTPSRAPPRPTSVHTVPDGECPCGRGALIMMTSRTASNFERQFYKCPKWDSGGCRYFAWVDSTWEAPATVRRQPNPPGASAHDDQFLSDDVLYGAYAGA